MSNMTRNASNSENRTVLNTLLRAKLGEPIIRYLTDMDFYKFTMWQAMLHHTAQNQARYEFVCRNVPKVALSLFKEAVEEQLDYLCELRFTRLELLYLEARTYFKRDFLEFLRLFQFNRKHITVSTKGDTLSIVAEGTQAYVMPFEIFVLSIVNELYSRLGFDEATQEAALAEGQKRLQAKIAELGQALEGLYTRFGFEFFDFGTRRRYSRQWQEQVVVELTKNPITSPHFKGTSNVYLAMTYGLVPIGTMAHEWLQTFQAMPGVQLRHSQREALETWVKEYRGELGIALTDVIGMDAFLADFDLYFAKLYDGMRHDSGEPVWWGEKAIAHYDKLRIDPASKRLVFSDGLKLGASAVALHKHFANRIRVGLGIGTNLTHDMGLIEPLNVVMKLTQCNGQSTAKLSDSSGKTLCTDETFLAYLRQTFNKAA